MAIKRPKAEEIVIKLRQVEVLMGQGPLWCLVSMRKVPITLASQIHCLNKF